MDLNFSVRVRAHEKTRNWNAAFNPEAATFLPHPQQKDENISASAQTYTTNSLTISPTINLHEVQRQDENISKIIDLKRLKKLRPDMNERKDNPALINYWHNYDQLFIHNGLLVRSRHKHLAYPNHDVVIPQSIVPRILDGMHDNPSCGHFGSARTEERIRERFYWPNMRASVQLHIQQCMSCQRRKPPPNPGNASMKTIDVGEPFTFWALDYMGPMSETSRGNKRILVVMSIHLPSSVRLSQLKTKKLQRLLTS